MTKAQLAAKLEEVTQKLAHCLDLMDRGSQMMDLLAWQRDELAQAIRLHQMELVLPTKTDRKLYKSFTKVMQTVNGENAG
jgi:hypothetical protein